MNALHTPGPWKAGWGKTWSKGSLRIPSLIVASDEEHTQPGFVGGIICAVSPTDTTTKQDEANARLIAAAPDLLAILQRVLPTLDDAEQDARFTAGTGDMKFREKWESAAKAYKEDCDAARAAIAKAKGEAP